MTGTLNKPLVSKLLTNLSNKITPENYISEQILPMVRVKNAQGKLGSYGTSHLRIENTITSGKNQYPEVQTVTYTTQQYDIVKHGLKDYITEEDKENVEAPFDSLESDKVDELTTKLWLGKEKSLADSLFNPSIMTNGLTLSGSAQFNLMFHEYY